MKRILSFVFILSGLLTLFPGCRVAESVSTDATAIISCEAGYITMQEN